MNKKLLLTILVIVILIFAGIFTAKIISKNSKTIDTMSNKTEITNVTENKIENKVDNTENNLVANEIESSKITEDSNKTNNTFPTSVENKKEKAIEIVKKDWGEDNTVNFICEGQNEKGEYIICVRENATTKALFWYYVNVDKGTFITD